MWYKRKSHGLIFLQILIDVILNSMYS